MERKIIILLTFILIVIGVTGCAKQKKINTVPTEMDTIGNLEAISTVLGCMFNPASCQDKKELAKTEDK